MIHNVTYTMRKLCYIFHIYSTLNVLSYKNKFKIKKVNVIQVQNGLHI